MSSIFIETLSKAIRDYRQLLRRYLPPSERASRLRALNLKPLNYENETELYSIGEKIIQDIEMNLNNKELGYYSYSGIGNFAQYLRDFLSNYIIEGNCVIHRAQKASRAFLQSIQSISLLLDEATPKQLEIINQNSQVIALYGSEEQRDLYKKSLERCYRERGAFFGSLLRYFEEQLNLQGASDSVSEAA